jgi:hypothetical protein
VYTSIVVIIGQFNCFGAAVQREWPVVYVFEVTDAHRCFGILLHLVCHLHEVLVALANKCCSSMHGFKLPDATV